MKFCNLNQIVNGLCLLICINYSSNAINTSSKLKNMLAESQAYHSPLSTRQPHIISPTSLKPLNGPSNAKIFTKQSLNSSNNRLSESMKDSQDSSQLSLNNHNRKSTNTVKYDSNAVKYDSNKVLLNFNKVDIGAVIRSISKLSGKNFVIDPRVTGTITIISEKPVSKQDSYKILADALRMQGFATIEYNGVIRVLPVNTAKTYGLQTHTGSNVPNHIGDQIVTQVFVINNGSAVQLANALRPLITPDNAIAVYPDSNALIISDYASNLVRISQIIQQMIQGNSNTVQAPVIVTLQNSVAADVAQTLKTYLAGGSAGNISSNNGPNVFITTDIQTNSLIMSSPIHSKLEELKNLALKIDQTTGATKNNLHVVYLKNADAFHVAEVLNAVVSGHATNTLNASSNQAKFAVEPNSVFNSTSGGGSSGGGGGGGGSIGASPQAQQQTQSNTQNNKDYPQILVQAEPTTNSLIIQAPPAIYKNLRMIIEMLDIRRVQVMIEAMIASVNTTQAGTFGIQWLVGGGGSNGGILALSNYGQNGNSLSNLATNLAGAGAALGGGGTTTAAPPNIPGEVYVGLVTGTTTVGGQTIPTLGALADMITSNSVGNILSRPTMIVLDNETARIMVGSNIGIPNGSFTATSGSPGNLTTTITRQDLGTVLQIRPMITQNGAIQLDVWQENSTLDPNQTPTTLINGPSFLRQNMRTTLLVDDGQIIALGGMTQDSITLIQSGVPGLSEIPYLGWLFSWQQRQHTKTNLVLFLRPVVIKNADGYKALTNQRYQYVLSQQNNVQAKGNLVLPNIRPVNLDNQLPYSTGALPGQNNPSLNLNKQLPVVDLTDDGSNVSKSDPQAVSVSITKFKNPSDSNYQTDASVAHENNNLNNSGN